MRSTTKVKVSIFDTVIYHRAVHLRHNISIAYSNFRTKESVIPGIKVNGKIKSYRAIQVVQACSSGGAAMENARFLFAEPAKPEEIKATAGLDEQK